MQELRMELDDLAIDYGSRRVVSGVSLTLHAGETLTVAGANGSGKSSLLRILCGLQRPSRGAVRYVVAGEVLQPDAARDLIGWLSPDLQLYRELTAAENLRFFAQVRGLQFSDADLEGLLAEVGLSGRGQDLLAAYSSGMAQRLRYAYALLHNPPILLLDEPTVTFDERGAALFERVAERQRERGILVIATNDPRELRFGDYVLRLGI
jgi:heme exporter protein A